MKALQNQGGSIKTLAAIVIVLLPSVLGGEPNINIVVQNSPGTVVNITAPRPVATYFPKSPCAGAIVYAPTNPYMVVAPTLVQSAPVPQPQYRTVFIPPRNVYYNYGYSSYGYRGGYWTSGRYGGITYMNTPYQE